MERKVIEMDIRCKSCGGTGVYVGLAERDGAAVVCNTCKGTGKQHYKFEYEEFTGKKKKNGVERVYVSSYGYVITPKKISFEGIGEIDMSHEGVSYEEYLSGKMPTHIESMVCPMMADQGACHSIEGFTQICNTLNGGWLGYIPKCKNKRNMKECWKRFNAGE